METEQLQGTEGHHWEAEGLDLDDFTLEKEHPETSSPPVFSVIQNLKGRILDLIHSAKLQFRTLRPPYKPHIDLPVLNEIELMRGRIFALADEIEELKKDRKPHGHLDHELQQAVVTYAKSSPALKRRMVSALLASQASEQIKAQTPPLPALESPTPEL
ncbi:MAG: hypothetical protein AAB802_00730 [Patescibacteria group bacterium]